MNMEFTLSNLENKYTIFQEGQVLNHSQLNSVVNYLDEQSRLTRTCLIGVGVVCGLEIESDIDSKGIIIRKGCAVTTDGDLIHLDEDVTLRYFIPYSNRSYPHFDEYLPIKKERVKNIWKLTDEKETEEYASIAELTNVNSAGNLDNLVIVLYLEEKIKDATACTEITCDSLGSTKEFNLHFLAIPYLEVENSMLPYDELYRSCNDFKTTFDSLPFISIPRVNITSDLTSDYQEVADEFNNKIKSFLTTSTTTSSNHLDYALDLLQTHFNQILAKDFSTNDWGTRIAQVCDVDNFDYANFDRLYVYGWLRDITSTYLELRECLLKACAFCCPDVMAFPKHILLGRTSNSGLYRHEFYPAKSLVSVKEGLGKASNLYKKLHLLINNFELPNHNSSKIKITPSRKPVVPLSEKAVPFYYANAGTTEFKKAWNFEKSINNHQDEIQGYRMSSPNFVSKPFIYDISKYDFFRVEGHIGKNYKDVIQEVKRLRTENNLPFNVVAMQLGDLVDISLSKDILLSEYIKTHRGLEYLSGAPAGGTIVIVHVKEERQVYDPTEWELDEGVLLPEDKDVRRVRNDIAEPVEKMDKIRKGLTMGSDSIVRVAGDKKYTIKRKEGKISPTKMMRTTGLPEGKTSNSSKSKNLPELPEFDSIVVADFCIPYLCCGEDIPIQAYLVDLDTNLLVKQSDESDFDTYIFDVCACDIDGEFDGCHQLAVKPKGGTFRVIDSSLAGVTSGEEYGPYNSDDEFDYMIIPVFFMDYGDHKFEYTVNGETIEVVIRVFCPDAGFSITGGAGNTERGRELPEAKSKVAAKSRVPAIDYETLFAIPPNPSSIFLQANDLGHDSYQWKHKVYYYNGSNSDIVESGVNGPVYNMNVPFFSGIAYYEISLRVRKGDCEEEETLFLTLNSLGQSTLLKNRPSFDTDINPGDASNNT